MGRQLVADKLDETLGLGAVHLEEGRGAHVEAAPGELLGVVVLAALVGEHLQGGGDEGAPGGGVAPELDLMDPTGMSLDAGQDAVHPGVGDGALLDREEAAPAAVDEAGIAELASGGEAHVVAVAPRVVGTDDRAHGGLGEAADAGELLAHDALLGGELRGVLQVLELAAAALAEE